MSDQAGDKSVAGATKDAKFGKPEAARPEQLAGLMADGQKGVAKAAPDLDAEAVRAAEAALREGDRALANARAELQGKAPTSRGSRRRELVLRVLLAVNVLAMVVVLGVPSSPATTPTTSSSPTTEPAPAPAADPVVPPPPQFDDPWQQALVAADRRDWKKAVAILDQHLADSPRMSPRVQLSVLLALEHYSAQLGSFTKAQDYHRRAEAIERSHSLPDDLVAMAKAAAESGDQESLRRVWARFLLQQRQVPGWLYKHVAAAYLQLGDSYRLQANAAAEAARKRELAETAARVRQEADGGRDGPGGKERGK